MAEWPLRNDLPVVLLHNLDPDWEPQEIRDAQREVGCLEAAIRAEGHPVANVAVRDEELVHCLMAFDPREHVVLNWCEGIPGLAHSEALVARALDLMGFAYTGSAAGVLALSWDKRQVKRLLDKRGVSTPRWRVCEDGGAEGWNCFPAIVKPSLEHCSLGVTADAVVLDREELEERIAFILREFDQPALVEDFIDGREFHVSLWGNGEVQMLPPAEMDFSAFSNVKDRVCTYDSKFLPGSVHYDKIELRLPAALDVEEHRLLEETAMAAYREIGCRDYARVDLRLREGVFYVLDVNPNPDISSETSMAAAAELAGFSYGAMVSRLVNLAALRHPIYGAEPHWRSVNTRKEMA
jgi:D-alanine-D-alanine ligase